MTEENVKYKTRYPKHRAFGIFLFCAALAGCETVPDAAPSSRQQAEADVVVSFQSWRAISFVKPDITGAVNTLSFRRKTFTREGVVKLLRNLKVGRAFVVVVLDRQYSPDPMRAAGGIDEIQGFFQELGFRRVAFHDGSAWQRSQGMPIVKDTAKEKGLSE